MNYQPNRRPGVKFRHPWRLWAVVLVGWTATLVALIAGWRKS